MSKKNTPYARKKKNQKKNQKNMQGTSTLFEWCGRPPEGAVLTAAAVQHKTSQWISLHCSHCRAFCSR